MKNKMKFWKKLGVIIIAILLAVGIGFGIYVSDYYRADGEAVAILEQDNVIEEGDWIMLSADTKETGFIFYPGAKVEYTSYLPLMAQLNEQDVTCFLVEMPFHLAFFGSNMAEKIMEEHPEIEHWYIGGHSLGGAFSSSFASKHTEEVDGVILLGAYLYGGYPEEKSLTIYGDQDFVLNREKITYTENILVLDGGNHAQFGNYGEQDGDGAAEISWEEQQEMTVQAIVEFFHGDVG